jgi:hypothetical protein
MELNKVFDVTTKVIASGTGILVVIGIVKGIIKYIRMRFINKNIRFTYRGEEELQ